MVSFIVGLRGFICLYRHLRKAQEKADVVLVRLHCAGGFSFGYSLIQSG